MPARNTLRNSTFALDVERMDLTDRFSKHDLSKLPIETLIKHRAPMLLVKKVAAIKQGCVTVEVDTSDSELFFDSDGMVPAWVGIEYMAQAIATYAGLVALQAGEPTRLGFLLGTRKYSAQVNHFQPNEQLNVTAEEIMRDSTNLVLFRCKIWRGEEEIAHAEIKAIQPDDFAAAMAMFEKNN